MPCLGNGLGSSMPSLDLDQMGQVVTCGCFIGATGTHLPGADRCPATSLIPSRCPPAKPTSATVTPHCGVGAGAWTTLGSTPQQVGATGSPAPISRRARPSRGQETSRGTAYALHDHAAGRVINSPTGSVIEPRASPPGVQTERQAGAVSAISYRASDRSPTPPGPTPLPLWGIYRPNGLLFPGEKAAGTRAKGVSHGSPASASRELLQYDNH